MPRPEFARRNDDIVSRWQAGWTLRAIGASLSLTSERVRQILQRRGCIAKGPPRLPQPIRSIPRIPDGSGDALVATIRERYAAGESLRAISEAVGLHHEQVRRIVQVRTRDDGPRDTSETLDPAIALYRAERDRRLARHQAALARIIADARVLLNDDPRGQREAARRGAAASHRTNRSRET